MSRMQFEIWKEGYRHTSGRFDSKLLGTFPGETFDEAVEYANTNHGLGVVRFTLEDFVGEYHYNKRSSNWRIDYCGLFANRELIPKV